MDITALATLPDEEDETVGGLLTNEELMLELSTLCVKYTPQQRLHAAATWVVTGNMVKVAKLTGIPYDSIRYWKNKSSWWKELVRQVRKAKQEELDGALTGIIMSGVDQLQDRITHGNIEVRESQDDDGVQSTREVRVPLRASELATAALGIPYDKRALLRGDPTARTEKSTSEETNALLAQLADNFKKFAAQIKPQYLPPTTVEGEFTEVSNL